MKFITGNGGDVWHLAKDKDALGNKTGKFISRYTVTACDGRQLGGVWGYVTRTLAADGAPAVLGVFGWCVRLLRKQGTTITAV